MITFRKLKVKNFMSVGNRPIEFDLAKNNTTLVVGENGCGKSQCYTDAITYVLFNKSFRGINKPALVNSINGGNCLVEIEFEQGNNEYLIRRGQKPNLFEIHKNGVLVPQDASAKDYQTMLEKNILGMNFRSFTQIVILGSASFTPFMQLPAAQRREVIEEILEIQVFSTMHSLLKNRISELKDQKKDTEYALTLVDEKIKMNDRHRQKTVDTLSAQNESAQEKIDISSAKIKEYNDEISSLRKQIAEHEKTITDAGSVLSKTKQLETYKHKIESNRKRVNGEIEFFHDNTTCPTCKQNIDNDFKSEAIRERNEKIDQFTDGLQQLQEAMDEVTKRQQEIDDINVKTAELASKVSSATHKVSAESEYISKLQSDITANNKKIGTISAGGELSNGEKEALQQEKEAAQTKSEDITRSLGYSDIASRLLKDTGIKTKIIRQYLPIINKQVNAYLTKLNFPVLFTLDEEFKETIKSRYRDNFSYESFSEGEKARINISLLLTWREIARRKNSAACNLLILDEVFSSALDLEGTGGLMELLNQSNGGKHKSNIVVISHTIPDISSDRDRFDEIIRVSKVNNFSQYKYENGD